MALMSVSGNTTAAIGTIKVTALTGQDFQALDFDATFGSGPTKFCCCSIEMAGAGTLVYTNPNGKVITTAFAAGGVKPINAQAIGAGTTVDVVCYF